MADLEQRVDKLEDKVAKLEKEITTSLGDIKIDLVEIKGYVKNGDTVIEEKIKNHDERIKKLEGIVSKITWAIIIEVLGLVGSAVIFYIKSGI